MEIKITSDTTPGWVFRLVSDDTGQVDDLAADFGRNIEWLAFLRAPGIEAADRANQSVDLQVSIAKHFDNLVQCGLFLLDLGNNVPPTGRVEVTITDANGVKGMRLLEKAAIHRITPRKMGVSCVVVFHIRGGVVKKVK